MAKKNFGFSLTELLVGITIIGVMAATITLSANSMKVTAKHEAEKVAQFLIQHINKADKTHQSLVISGDKNILQAGNDKLRASMGCSFFYEDNKSQLYYHVSKDFTPRLESADVRVLISSSAGSGEDKDFYIGVKGKGDDNYVIIKPINEGTKLK